MDTRYFPGKIPVVRGVKMRNDTVQGCCAYIAGRKYQEGMIRKEKAGREDRTDILPYDGFNQGNYPDRCWVVPQGLLTNARRLPRGLLQ